MTNSRIKTTMVKLEYIHGSDFTTTSTSAVAVTAFTITLANNTGKSIIAFNVSNECTSTNSIRLIVKDATVLQQEISRATVTDPSHTTPVYVAENDGQAIALYARVSAGTGTVFGTAASESSLEGIQIT